MAIVTVSQQAGSLESNMAARLAERLNYELIDKTEIQKLVAEYACDAGSGIPSIVDESIPDWISHLIMHKSFYKHLIRAVIYDAASQGNVVIKGRGANFLLFGLPDVLCFRIAAPLARRVATLRKQMPGGAEAELLVVKEDCAQQKFVHFFHGQDIGNPDYYDMIINTGKVDRDEVFQILLNRVNALKQRSVAGTQACQWMKNLSIEMRIKAMILKKEAVPPNWKNLSVYIGEDGCVTLSGIATSDFQKAMVGDCAMAVLRDRRVTNDMAVISTRC